MLHDVFARRFREMDAAFGQLKFETRSGASSAGVSAAEWEQWGTSAHSLIRAVFGEGSPHCTNFVNAYRNCGGYESHVRRLHGIFRAAKDDFEGGYVFNVDLRVSGEVFGDFVTLSKQALGEGHKDVAAVLACAALEDALKRYAGGHGLDVRQKSMQDVVNALKGAGLVSGAQKSLLDAMPRVRNLAMHGDWEKVSEPDVNSVIGFVEQFLLTKFSGP